MKIIHVVIAVFLIVGCSGSGRAYSEDTLQRSIAAAAKGHNTAGLLSLADQVQHSSRTTKAMYEVALYEVQPSRYKRRFIDSFPSDSSRVMGLMYTVTRLLGTNRWYPYDALGRLALSGDPRSIRKLMLVLTIADGGPAELLGDGLGKTTQLYPNTVLQELQTLPKARREKLTSDPYPWCSAGASALNRMTPENNKQLFLKGRLRNAASRCE